MEMEDTTNICLKWKMTKTFWKMEDNRNFWQPPENDATKNN